MRKKCADCGVPIEPAGHRDDGSTMWGSKILSVDDQDVSFICRWTPGTNPGTVATVDYHYVDGEEQRHFRAEPR